MPDDNPGEGPGNTSRPTAPEKPAPTDDLVTTSHELLTPQGSLRYTAAAGRVVLREEAYEDEVFHGSKAKAEVFIVSYVADSSDRGKRPVTFAFNGGPGSSSAWLHLGLLGPRRVVMGDVGVLAAPPYGLTDNIETLLAHSDLVRNNPHLRVQLAAGYYDGATPYFAAEHTVHHLRLPQELRGNASFRYYEAGHMMYVHEESRLRQSADLSDFITGV